MVLKAVDVMYRSLTQSWVDQRIEWNVLLKKRPTKVWSLHGAAVG